MVGLVAAWNAADFPEAEAVTAAAVDSDGDSLSDYLELTADVAGVPFRVETSTTDAGGFSVDVETLQEGIPETNEKQKITLNGSPTGGTFTLTFQAETTAAIAYNATAAAVETALEGLASIVAGDVIVTGSAGGPYTVEFDQNYGGINVPLITADGSSLTGVATVSIETTQQGSDTTDEIQKIDYSQPSPGAGTPSLLITDPISGAQKSFSFSESWSQSQWQTAFDNALTALGTGGTVTLSGFVQDNEITATFRRDLGGPERGGDERILGRSLLAASDHNPGRQRDRAKRDPNAWPSCTVPPAEPLR